MNKDAKNQNILQFRIPPVKVAQLKGAADQRGKTCNAFCKELVLLVLEFEQCGVCLSDLIRCKRGIIHKIKGDWKE